MPINRYLTFQPSYIRHNDGFLTSVSFLGLGLIIKTDKLLSRGRVGLEKAAPGKHLDDSGTVLGINRH